MIATWPRIAAEKLRERTRGEMGRGAWGVQGLVLGGSCPRWVTHPAGRAPMDGSSGRQRATSTPLPSPALFACSRCRCGEVEVPATATIVQLKRAIWYRSNMTLPPRHQELYTERGAPLQPPWAARSCRRLPTRLQ